jgi:hypothetical protein
MAIPPRQPAKSSALGPSWLDTLGRLLLLKLADHRIPVDLLL